jgi:hypothetical protein
MYQLPLSTSLVEQSQPEIVPTSQTRPSETTSAALGIASSQINARSPRGKKSQLSCINCQRKKVKCDRADPCSRCSRVGAICVSSPPSSAPRGRKGGRPRANHKLLDRIAKLENLVKDIAGRYTGESAGATIPENETNPV